MTDIKGMQIRLSDSGYLIVVMLNHSGKCSSWFSIPDPQGRKLFETVTQLCLACRPRKSEQLEMRFKC
jgi:hypothetical protein